MRVSINWLREFVDFDLSPGDLADTLTMLGLEIEAIESMAEGVENVKVGEIKSIEPHPDADRLVVCRTDVGEGEPLQIVCGAKNMKAGDRVPTAVVGGSLPGFKIGKRKMRGVVSHGMMCSAKELGLGEDHSGLLILDPAAEIGADAVELLGLNDTVLDIEITPNRGDWAGMIGIARELAAHLNVPLTLPDDAVPEAGDDVAAVSSVTIDDPELCPRYAGRVLRGVTVARSPAWLCQRLVAAGQRPINNIVDITNYVLMETGQPLHGFDFDQLNDGRIVIRRARKGESIRTLDGEQRSLTEEMLVIADASVPVAIAGVMGGADSEVGEESTSVFLESAHFQPRSIRKTSRALGLISEASTRFQRGADPEMVVYAANRAAKLMVELAGASVHPGIMDAYPAPPEQRRVRLRFARTNALLGTDVPAAEQKALLSRLGFKETDSAEDSSEYAVPARRYDVAHEADLVEEVARLHGFDRIPITLPRVRPREEILAPAALFQRRLRDKLVELGLTEHVGMTFSSDAAVDQANLQFDQSRLVRLQNPLSERHAIMRPSLVPGILETVSHNDRHGIPSLRLFELGPAFTTNEADELAEENVHAVIALTGSRRAQAWHSAGESVDFFDIKGIAESILDFARIDAEFRHTEIAPFAAGHCAEIETESGIIGFLGKVDTAIRDRFNISKPVYLLDLNVTTLLAEARRDTAFVPIPKFPPALFDIALVVDIATPAEDLRKAAIKAGGKRLKTAEIFDIYTGDQVESGKKSLALKLIFQTPDRTLTDKETSKDFDKIAQALAHEFGATLR